MPARRQGPVGGAYERLIASVAFEAIWERDLDSEEMSWSGSLEPIFGYKSSEIVGHLSWWKERVHPGDLERVVQTAEQAIRSGASRWANEYRFRRKDGSWAWVASRCAIERDGEGRAVRAVGALIDISTLKETEARLLHLVIDTLPVGVTFLDQAGDIQLANPASKRIWGGMIVNGKERYAKSKGTWHVSGKTIEPDDWASLHALAGETRLNELVDFEAFDGQWKTMRNSAVPIRDEQQAIVGAVVVNEDVTRQVRAEEELRWKRVQLQALSRQLIEAQEAERRAVARELHDDFGQVLTALKLHLGRKDRDDAESIALVDGAIARMRDLAHDLRPPMLDELGLEASLRWYVEREARRAGLEFDLALSPVEPRPPPAVESTCFRVAQEALTNVIRHAQARRVEVELGIADGALQLVVRDDGRGFDVADARRRAIRGESQGLLGMQERVDLAGGDLEMESTPGQGTAVRARFPIPPAAPGGK